MKIHISDQEPGYVYLTLDDGTVKTFIRDGLRRFGTQYYKEKR